MRNSIIEKSLSLELLAKTHGHKFDYGHLLVLSGDAGKTGAARLAARGGLRIGAGVVTIAAPPDACPEIAAQITAVMLRPFADQIALAQVLEDQRINAVAIGPGLGVSAEKAALVRAVLDARRRTVLDADALTLIAQDGALSERLHDDCVLTPHNGEFARLFPDLSLQNADAASDEKDRADTLGVAARRAGCTVLQKGANTIIAAPGGEVAVHRAEGLTAAPWLATAGSGDVLTGFIGGLLARGADPFEAASNAAWLHAACARQFGPGLIAEDLPEQLPSVLHRLLG